MFVWYFFFFFFYPNKVLKNCLQPTLGLTNILLGYNYIFIADHSMCPPTHFNNCSLKKTTNFKTTKVQYTIQSWNKCL